MKEQDTQNATNDKRKTFTPRNCTRCGKCCSDGSPTLLKEDLSLFISSVLSTDKTYTIREGELVRSYENGEMHESFMEVIKIKEKNSEKYNGKGCIFYENEGVCSIYENMPTQCRAYECWSKYDTQNIGPQLEGLEGNRLTRKELFSSVDLLIDVIDRHEEKCSYKKLLSAIERLPRDEEKAIEDIMDMLQYDTYIRPFLEEKFNILPDAVDLILGMPLIRTINEFGFKVEKDGDDYILLPMQKNTEKKR